MGGLFPDRRTGIEVNTLRTHLPELKDKGLLFSTRQGKEQWYEAAPAHVRCQRTETETTLKITARTTGIAVTIHIPVTPRPRRPRRNRPPHHGHRRNSWRRRAQDASATQIVLRKAGAADRLWQIAHEARRGRAAREVGTLTEENIKAELSYAYLHAVASRAGFSCAPCDRHADGAGIDAKVSAYGQLAADSVLTDFSLEVQLKATARRCRSPRGRVDCFSHDLEVPHYDKLRKTSTESQRILVVFVLPEKANKWLKTSAQKLIAERCAYWISLRGAPASLNDERQVVHVPKANVLTVEALRDLMTRLSREERVPYVA